MLESLREDVAAAARAVASSGLVTAAQGNVSAREDGLIAVTRTGVALSDATAADVSVVDTAGRLLEGETPSSELLVHLAIYAAFDARAIVHSHAQAVLAAGERAGVPIAAWAPEGSQALADGVIAVLRGSERIAVMAGHGTVAHAATLDEAVAMTLALERACAAA